MPVLLKTLQNDRNEAKVDLDEATANMSYEILCTPNRGSNCVLLMFRLSFAPKQIIVLLCSRHSGISIRN
jgi:hypothetical protein